MAEREQLILLVIVTQDLPQPSETTEQQLCNGSLATLEALRCLGQLSALQVVQFERSPLNFGKLRQRIG